MLYSVKMRSSLGGYHGEGGRHISGAERIVPEDQVEADVIAMLRRARTHERGAADFIQVKVEEVKPQTIAYCPMIPIYQMNTSTREEGRETAKKELARIGVSEAAIRSAFHELESLTDSMRGAIVMDAVTGERLDDRHERGVRCSNMDCEDTALYDEIMGKKALAATIPGKRWCWHPRWPMLPARWRSSAGPTTRTTSPATWAPGNSATDGLR